MTRFGGTVGSSHSHERLVAEIELDGEWWANVEQEDPAQEPAIEIYRAPLRRFRRAEATKVPLRDLEAALRWARQELAK